MTLAGNILNAEGRTELLMPMYLYLLLWFFIYCYPIARATVALEKRFAGEMMALWTPRSPLVEMRDVHKTFGKVEVLKGISLNVMKGEVICIIGPSGSGKSTLLRCVNALVPIDAARFSSRARRSTIPSSTSSRCAARSAWCSSNTICFRTRPRWKTS